MRASVNTFSQMKADGEKVVFLTAYDWMLAGYVAQAQVDGILVGDSVAQVFGGHDSTLPATLDEMIYHARAARRGAPEIFLLVDMPFLSFQISPEDTLRNAGRVMKETGAQGVKLEGGARLAETIRRLTDVGIPVMGHLGLTPQSIHAFGGYDLRATDETSADELVADAIALSEAGCFSIVLEKIPRALGARVTTKIPAVTLGIGAGPETDGQILVTHDVLGMTPDFRPKFVRRYADLDQVVAGALEKFVTDVRAGRFPGEAESFE